MCEKHQLNYLKKYIYYVLRKTIYLAENLSHSRPAAEVQTKPARNKLMSMKFMRTLVFIPALTVAACSEEPFEPIVDGRVPANYQSDLADCRGARTDHQQEYNNGAVIGDLIAASDSHGGVEIESAIIGAVLVGAIGRAGENEDIQKRRMQILVNCMRGCGHNVVG